MIKNSFYGFFVKLEFSSTFFIYFFFVLFYIKKDSVIFTNFVIRYLETHPSVFNIMCTIMVYTKATKYKHQTRNSNFHLLRTNNNNKKNRFQSSFKFSARSSIVRQDMMRCSPFANSVIKVYTSCYLLIL